MTLSVTCIVLRQHDEPMNAGGFIRFYAAPVKAADGCHRDFQVAQPSFHRR